MLRIPPAYQKAKALFGRSVIHWKRKDWLASKNDFEAVLAQLGISLVDRIRALFALPEPIVAIEPLHRVVDAVTIAFEKGDKASEAYGGTPGDLISMIVLRGPSEWAGYVAVIAPLYILKSDPPSDRPLFSLPLEFRQLVRPLLQNKLNGVYNGR